MAWQACDACGKQRAKWYCAADNAHLCKQCDNSIHSANVVARRHKRLPIKNPRPSPTPTPRPTPCSSSSLTPTPRNGRDGSGNGSNIFLKEECSVISPLGCVLWHCSPKKLRSLRPFNLPKNKNKLLPPDTPKPKPKPEPELEPEPETEIPDDDPYFDIDQLLLAEDPVNELDANFDEFFLFGGGEQILDMKKEDLSEEYKYSSSPLDSCLDDSSPRQESMTLSSSSPGRWLSDNLMTDMEQLCKEEEGDNLDDVELGCMKTEKLSLRLDYEELLSTWSDRGSAFSIQSQIVPDHHHPMDAITGQGQGHYEARSIYYGNSGQQEEILVPMLFHHPMMNMMNKLGREERVMRYREKRRTRLFSKIIRYEVRKLNAEKRPRLKGRFVRRTETETEDKSVGSDCIHPI